MKTYGRLPIALSHGRGCWVWDTEGTKYLDGLAGIAVNTLGHAHPKLVPALNDQIGKLIHSSNYYLVPLQEQLAALNRQLFAASSEKQSKPNDASVATRSCSASACAPTSK